MSGKRARTWGRFPWPGLRPWQPRVAVRIAGQRKYEHHHFLRLSPTRPARGIARRVRGAVSGYSACSLGSQQRLSPRSSRFPGMENAQRSDRQRCEGGAVQVRGDHVRTSSDLRRVRARKGKVSGRRRTQREGRGRAAVTSSEAGDAGSRCWQLRRGSPRPALRAGGALPGKAGVRQNAPEGEQGSRQGGRLGCF